MKEPRTLFGDRRHPTTNAQRLEKQVGFERKLGLYGKPLSALYGQPPRVTDAPFRLVLVTGPLNCQSAQVVWGASALEPDIRVIPRVSSGFRSRFHMALGPHAYFSGGKDLLDNALDTGDLLVNDTSFADTNRAAIHRNTWHLKSLWREARAMGGTWIAEHDFIGKARSAVVEALRCGIVTPQGLTIVVVLAPDGWCYIERSQIAGVTSLGTSSMAHWRNGPEAIQGTLNAIAKEFEFENFHAIFADGDLCDGAQALVDIYHGGHGALQGRGEIHEVTEWQCNQIRLPSLIPAKQRRFL